MILWRRRQCGHAFCSLLLLLPLLLLLLLLLLDAPQLSKRRRKRFTPCSATVMVDKRASETVKECER